MSWLLLLLLATEPGPVPAGEVSPAEGAPSEAVVAAPPPPAVQLLSELSGGARLGLGCTAGPLAGPAELAAAVSASTALDPDADLVGTWTAAATDHTIRVPGTLAWLRLGIAPVVGATLTPAVPPLEAGDRWSGHWSESPRLTADQAHTLRVRPHGRPPAPTQDAPSPALSAPPLPADGCVAWSLGTDHRGTPVERLLALSADGATLRTAAPSARATDAGPRQSVPMPHSTRQPVAVLVVNSEPHVVFGAPWLQDTGLPSKLRGLSALVPSELSPAPGQVRAWFEDDAGAALAVVMPLSTGDGAPADPAALLATVAGRFGLPGEPAATAGGYVLSSGGGVTLGARPGALVLSTDGQIVADILADTGAAWSHTEAPPEALASIWVASTAAGESPGAAVLSVEDGSWRLDAPSLGALTAARAWAGVQ